MSSNYYVVPVVLEGVADPEGCFPTVLKPSTDGVPGHKDWCVCCGCDGLRGLGAPPPFDPTQMQQIADLVKQGLDTVTAILKVVPTATPKQAQAAAPAVVQQLPPTDPLAAIKPFIPLALLGLVAIVALKK